MENLTLYKLATCPYCQKVFRFLDKHNLELKMLDITEGTNKEDLIRLGGEEQVPALLVDGKILYESDDIIKYLAEINNIETEDEDFQADINFCPIY